MSILRNCVLGVAMASSVAVAGAALTAEDYCNLTLNKPAGVVTPTPLPDGVSYAALSENGRSIDSYSYKTGK